MPTNWVRSKPRYGPEAAAFYAGTGSYERAFKDAFKLQGAEIYLATSILFPYGSPNTFGVGAPCYTSLGVLAPKLTMGCLHIDMFSDVDNSRSDCGVGNRSVHLDPAGACSSNSRTAADEGAEIIVIDPRKTAAAELPGMPSGSPSGPGSDGALALGLCHILIRDGKYDKPFVDDWTVGFKELRRLCQRILRHERVSGLTGIDIEIPSKIWPNGIEDAEGASYVMYTGLEYTKRRGAEHSRRNGALGPGRPTGCGGRTLFYRDSKSHPAAGYREDNWPHPALNALSAPAKFPVYAHYCGGEPHAILLPRAIIDEEPYPVKGLIVLGASPAHRLAQPVACGNRPWKSSIFW